MNLKIVSLGVLLGVALSSNSCTTNRNIPTKDISELVANTSTSYRTRIRQSEEEGVREIRGLVKSSPSEEAWAYLPKREL